jgi:hypothetical protein
MISMSSSVDARKIKTAAILVLTLAAFSLTLAASRAYSLARSRMADLICNRNDPGAWPQEQINGSK